MVPGNLRFQFYPVQRQVRTFALGVEDSLAVREDQPFAGRPGGASRSAT
jgi:hypothetical protein